MTAFMTMRIHRAAVRKQQIGSTHPDPVDGKPQCLSVSWKGPLRIGESVKHIWHIYVELAKCKYRSAHIILASALLAEALGSSKQGWHEDGQAAAQAMGMAWRASKDGMKVGKQPLKQWGQHSWWPFVLLVLIKLACMSVRSKQVSLAADSTHQKLANLCIDTQVCAHARACAPTNTHTYTHTPGGASPGAAHGVGWREGRAGRIWCRHLLDCCCGCCCCCCYSCVVVADFGWGWGMAWAGCTPFLVLDSSEGGQLAPLCPTLRRGGAQLCNNHTHEWKVWNMWHKYMELANPIHMVMVTGDRCHLHMCGQPYAYGHHVGGTCHKGCSWGSVPSLSGLVVWVVCVGAYTHPEATCTSDVYEQDLNE
eukprot:scaffold64391_cov17-Tisochrysis_lutea.AAC.1